MISRVKLTIIWKNIGAGYESDLSFKLGWSFSNGSLLGIKKKCTQVIFKSWSLSDYILGYNTLKIAPNNENGIKVCQMHKNFF